MSENARDTQFAGFASLLWKEIQHEYITYLQREFGTFAECDERVEQIIARHAYDLVQHSVESCEEQEDEMDCRIRSERLLRNIPDLMKFPEEGKG